MSQLIQAPEIDRAGALARRPRRDRPGAMPPRHRVVVVGGGFGGLSAVRALRRAPVDVTLVDRRNFHLFQPLVYQVATGALSPAEIAVPLRAVLRRQANARVLLAEVRDFDLERRGGRPRPARRWRAAVHLALRHPDRGRRLPYSYFGTTSGGRDAPELKSLEGALDIRDRVLRAFEAAEAEPDPERRRGWLTFVVVGAGPPASRWPARSPSSPGDTLRRDFRAVDTRTARILLVETADRVLTSFPESLSRKAARALERLGVTPLPAHTVVDVAPGVGRGACPGRPGRAARGAHRRLGRRRHRVRVGRRRSGGRPEPPSTGPAASPSGRG